MNWIDFQPCEGYEWNCL